MSNFERRLESLRLVSQDMYQHMDVNTPISETDEKIFRLMDLEMCSENVEMLAGGSVTPFESWKGKKPTWPKKTWSWLK